jgi:hypothetical protein
MIIYNVTVKPENNIADAWLQWMKDEHIPDVINTGCFTKATLCKLLEVDDEDGPLILCSIMLQLKQTINGI